MPKREDYSFAIKGRNIKDMNEDEVTEFELNHPKLIKVRKQVDYRKLRQAFECGMQIEGLEVEETARDIDKAA